MIDPNTQVRKNEREKLGGLYARDEIAKFRVGIR